MIAEHRPAILSCTSNPAGFFLPSLDPDVRRREINGTVDVYNSRIRHLAMRRKAILQAYPEAEQKELFIGGGQ